MSIPKIVAGGAEVIISAKDATAAIFGAIKGKIAAFGATVSRIGSTASGVLGSAGSALSFIAGGIEKVALGMMAAGAAIIGIGAKAASTISSIGDKYDKMALRTGASTEALSKFAFAADMSGTSIEAFETGLNKTSKFIAALEEGSDSAKDNLRKMGLTMADLEGKSPDEAMMTIGQALSQMDDKAARTALTLEVLGKGSNELMPLFLAGAGGMAEMADEAERLGAVVTRSQADVGAGMNDAFGRLGAATTGVFMKVGESIGPMLIDIVNKAAFAIAEIGPKIGNIAKTMLSIIVATADTFSSVWTWIKTTALDNFQGIVDAIPGLAFDLLAGWKIAVAKLAELFLTATTQINIALEQLVSGEALKKAQGTLADMLIDAQALAGFITDAEAEDIKQTRREDTNRAILNDPAMAESRKRQEQMKADLADGLTQIGADLSKELAAIDQSQQDFTNRQAEAFASTFSLDGLTEAMTAMADQIGTDTAMSDSKLTASTLEMGTAEARRQGELNKKSVDPIVQGLKGVEDAVTMLDKNIAEQFQFVPA